MVRNAKKRLLIFFMRLKKHSWDGKMYQNHGIFPVVRHTLKWYHLFRGFLHYHYRLHPHANKSNFHLCKWPIFKERYMEICQYIYNITFLERNEWPLSIVRMVYAEMVLEKQVDWKTIKIQPKSNMIAPKVRFIGTGRKFPHGGLGKKMPTKKVVNTMVVRFDNSSNDEHKSCEPLKRC
jgi:hypothetical protein